MNNTATTNEAKSDPRQTQALLRNEDTAVQPHDEEVSSPQNEGVVCPGCGRMVGKIKADPESEEQCDTCEHTCVCRNIRGNNCTGYKKKYKTEV